MKHTGHDPQLLQVLNKQQCNDIVKMVEEFHPARWFFRGKINSIPTKGTTDAHYYFCGDKQQPAEFRKLLWSLAPKIEGCTLAEAIINRYDVGSFMPEHIDQALYRYNLVITLCENGDGLTIRDEFVEDVYGRGIMFPARSAPHAVPPVKHQRYVLIYLYE